MLKLATLLFALPYPYLKYVYNITDNKDKIGTCRNPLITLLLGISIITLYL